MPPQVPRQEAERLKTHYVCSDCWGHLVLFPDPETRLIDVHCMTDDCPCNGFVTKGFIAQREQEQVLERMEARAALQGIVDWLEPRRSVAQNLRELGFG